jgi:hypothetical protein
MRHFLVSVENNQESATPQYTACHAAGVPVPAGGAAFGRYTRLLRADAGRRTPAPRLTL